MTHSGATSKLGLSSLVVIPIPVEDRVEAILVVGIEEHRGPSPQDVEVFQMLTTQAAVALENARRFERQRRSMERIAELDRMKSDFLSNISHELRTPLTVIAGVGRTLELSSNILSEDERRDLLARSNANAATLDGMLTGLLDFGRWKPDSSTSNRWMSPFESCSTGSPTVSQVCSATTRCTSTSRKDSRPRRSSSSKGWSRTCSRTPRSTRRREAASRSPRQARDGRRSSRSRTTDPGYRPTSCATSGSASSAEVIRTHDPPEERASARTRVRDPGPARHVPRGREQARDRFPIQLPTPRGCGAASGQPIRGETVISASALPESAQPLVVSDIGLPGRFETVLAAAQMGLEWPVAALCRGSIPSSAVPPRAPPDRAEELASETWSDIASALPTFEGNETSFRRWVFAAARRRLLEAREKSGSARSALVSEQDDDVSAERRAVDAALARINTLAPQQADVLLLRALGDLDVAEVAEIRGDPLDRARDGGRGAEALEGPGGS